MGVTAGTVGPVPGSLVQAEAACSRRRGAGAHQFQRPSSFIVAGTSSVRTIVASTTTARASPRPSCFMATISPAAKPANTMTISSAADVMIRPRALQALGHGAVVVAGLVPRLLDAGEQEHLVVHRQPEGEDEHDTGITRSSEPGGSKPSSAGRCPSWNTQTSAPNVAPSDSTFITIALTGSTTEPVIRNSSTNVATTMIAMAQRQAIRDRVAEVDDLGRVAADRTAKRRVERRARAARPPARSAPLVSPSGCDLDDGRARRASGRSTSTAPHAGHALDARPSQRGQRRVVGVDVRDDVDRLGGDRR